MSNKNIDSFLVDHEWLEANDKQNAPFSKNQSHEQLDALADAFSFEPPKKRKANFEEVTSIIANAKRELMLGRSMEHIERTVFANVSPEIRAVAEREIKKLSSEEGLLGNVYIDPAAFSSCEDGSKLLRNNRVATFAKKMASCGGCSQNQGGFCRLYKKALVSEVNFDQKTLTHYKQHLVSSGKIASGYEISSKVELQNAFLSVSSKKAQANSVVYHDESKRVVLKSKTSESTVSKEARDIAADLSKRLSAGMEPSLFKEYVTSRYGSSIESYSSVIRKYADLVGSIGRVFVEMEPFTNIEDARKFFAKHNPNVKYVLADSRKKYTPIDEKTLGKKIISNLSQIPVSEWEKNLKRAGKKYDSKELSSNPVGVTKKAFLDVNQSKKALHENKFEMESDFDLDGFDPKLASESVRNKDQIETQLRMGHPLTSILKHNERVSSTTISQIVKSYFETTSVVQATLFDTPCQSPHKINTHAKIAAKKECSSCPYNKGVLCTRLDRSFTVYANKSASTSTVSEIKVTNNKVAVTVDKNLEVELEESGLDDSISKYI